jgi:WXXGXW repeat (2 copies)
MRFSALLRACALAAAVSLTAAPSFAQTYVIPVVRVAMAPPPLRVETQPPQPSAAHVWIPGHWIWRGTQHEWSIGHWVIPPAGGYVWSPARWAAENGQWSFYEGHWRLANPPTQPVIYQPAAAPAQPVVVDAAPPAPIVEVRPAAPWANGVWIPGYWHWHGTRHFWVGGQWSAPHPGHVWEPHAWVHEGGRWRFSYGHWR